VGLILWDDRVIELPNRSMDARKGFVLFPADVKLALEGLKIDWGQVDWATITLWHSHPSGGVGPSRIDMKNKLPQLNHLVVTLTEDRQVIPTWY